MNVSLLTNAFKVLIKAFDADVMRDFADVVLEFVEKRVIGSSSKVDDGTVLPVCSLIRFLIGIKDRDDTVGTGGGGGR